MGNFEHLFKRYNKYNNKINGKDDLKNLVTLAHQARIAGIDCSGVYETEGKISLSLRGLTFKFARNSLGQIIKLSEILRGELSKALI